MLTLAQRPKGTRQTHSATKPMPNRARPGQTAEPNSILNLQRRFGNQAVLRMLSARRDFETGSSGREVTAVQDHFSPPGHDSFRRNSRPKLRVGAPGDRYEQEADQVANRVVNLKSAAAVSPAEPRDHSARQNTQTQIPPGSSFGEPLDRRTNEDMSGKIGFDFSNVRVHTGAPSIYLNQRLNARAFTYGSDIYFNKGEYDPNSSGGQKLLAHELAHVAQQAGMTDNVQRKMIQRTTIGDILDEFFSPFSTDTLWVMPEDDNYTQIVRHWQPVTNAITKAKENLLGLCAAWPDEHMTDPSWKPGMTKPPAADPNAFGEWVTRPFGTDPDTCKNAFIIYATSKASSWLMPIMPGVIPETQTFELYTCSIGSFGIYITVDSIDCAAHTAEFNIWMYNTMDRDSFAAYADDPVFSLSGMASQFMWWNWKESFHWGPAPALPAPVGGGGGGAGGW